MSSKKKDKKRAKDGKHKKKHDGAKRAPVVTGVPALTEPRAPKKLRSTEAVIENGLRVIAVRKPGVPVVEMRLRVPFLSARPTHPARAALLAETVATGAGDLDRTGIAAAVQALGGDLSVGVDADRMMLGGNVLSTNLGEFLDIVGAVLTAPAYQADEVATERSRLVEKLTIARPGPA